jgi:carbamoyl-phosphate synthase large subunit
MDIHKKFTSKTLMIVGASEWQVPIIKKAKNLGLRVLNSGPYQTSPGFEYSDVNLIADVLDKDKNLQFALKNRVDGILTDQTDIAVPTVAYIAERLNLPGIGIEVAKKFTNKYEMRNLCLNNGFPSPSFHLCKSVGDAFNFMHQKGLPFVLKPPANQSSRGVIKITHKDQVYSGYQRASSFTMDGTVLIESFIEGPELTIEGIKTHSKHYCLATSFKKHFVHNPMVASELRYSFGRKDINYKVLYNQHNRLIELMKLPFGLTHAEYKCQDGKFYLIEVAARGGGTKISSDLVPLISGIDTNERLITMALGDHIDDLHFSSKSIEGILYFFNFNSGKIKSIEGVEEIMKMKGVVDFNLNFKTGDLILPPEDDRSRHGFIIAVANDNLELENLLNNVKSSLKINYE